jgi:hypothetical protein
VAVSHKLSPESPVSTSRYDVPRRPCKSIVLVICEPDFHDSMVATYRCRECGLLDRAEVVLQRATPVRSGNTPGATGLERASRRAL